jgi:hypothetical protein
LCPADYIVWGIRQLYAETVQIASYYVEPANSGNSQHNSMCACQTIPCNCSAVLLLSIACCRRAGPHQVALTLNFL